MSDLSVTNTFITNATVSASELNTNYSDISTFVNNLNSATSTWDAMYSTSSTNVPLTANNSSGTQSIVQAKDNGTTVFEVFDGGIFSATNQVFGNATKSSSQSFTDTDNVKVTFPSVSQTGSEFSVSDSRFTCDVPGKYIFTIKINVQVVSATIPDSIPVAANSIGMYVAKNGTAVTSVYPMSSYPSGTKTLFVNYKFCDVLSLAQADYIEIFVNGSIYSGEFVTTVNSSSERTYFNFMKLS